MKHQIALCYLFFNAVLYSPAQNPQFEWAKHTEANNVMMGFSLAVDGFGNVYTAGIFTGANDFNPGQGETLLTAIGEADLFLQKLDAEGNLVWVKQIASNWLVGAYQPPFPLSIGGGGSQSMAVDKDNNIILCSFTPSDTIWPIPEDGSEWEALTTQPESMGSYDILVLKLDPDGDLMWGHRLGGTAIDLAFNCALDNDGNIFVAGNFQDTVDFDPDPTATSVMTKPLYEQGKFLMKLNVDGNFLWVKEIPGLGSIYTSTDGSIYCTGQCLDTIAFNSSQSVNVDWPSTFSSGAYLLNVNGNGGFESVIVCSSSSAMPSVASCTVDGNSNIWMATNFVDTVHISLFGTDQSFTIVENQDFLPSSAMLLIKLSPSGELLYSGQTQMSIVELLLGKQDAVFSFGSISNEVIDVEPGVGVIDPMTNGNSLGVFKLHSDGQFAWSGFIGPLVYAGLGNGNRVDFGMDSLNNIYITSEFRQTPDLNPSPNESYTLTSLDPSTPDMFTLKWSDPDEPVTAPFGLVSHEISLYPNPVTREVSLQLPNDYTEITIRITNMIGQQVYTTNSILKEKINGSLVQIDMSNLPNGVYLLHATNKEYTISTKFIKK